MAHLDVFTPSEEAQAQKPEKPPNMLRVGVFQHYFTINDRRLDVNGLERMLIKLALLDKEQSVMINVSAQSPHESLVKALDLCTQAELRNLSVFSAH